MLNKLLEKRMIISIALAVLVVLVVPLFITYDTGIRCIQAPCENAEAATSFLGWLMKGQPLIYDADYYLPTIGFFVYGGLTYWLYPKVFKKDQS